MITRIDGIVLSDKMKEKIKYFQSNGDIYLDKLDEILDNIINADRDNLQRQVDNICVIREMYRLLKCIAEAGKEANND
nr:MAG TPA: hypothetical protein [Caudoviricetes sp.]